MNLHEQVVYGPGYAVVEADHMDKLDQIKEKFIDVIHKFDGLENIQKVDQLREKLVSMEEKQINKLKLHLNFNFPEISTLLQDAFAESTKQVSGSAIFLQRRSHIMFNVPGIKNTSVMHHLDGMSGISPFSYVLWSALHDIPDDSGVWIIDMNESMKLINEEFQIRNYVMGDYVLDKKYEAVQLKYGQGVIFNPYLLHGSIAHQNELSRIGITNRFQSRNKPLFLRNSDFYFPYSLS
jgi:sporadic carbohydrate cluster 2OG-Fe(II) oxygenase